MIFLLLFLLPMAAAMVVEYLFCRIPRRRVWRIVPPAALAVFGAVALWSRHSSWGEGDVPLESLLFFPGVPILAIALGFLLGWRLWHRIWDPRVVKDGK